MKFIFLHMILCIGSSAITQIKDSSFCQCGYSFTFRFPKAAEKNKISGDLVVEMDVDENCILSNPRVIKNIGYGCDEEALRAVSNMITSRNKCILKQRCRDCKKGKMTQTPNPV
ncbi:MAG TPA: energy transducer TonB [Puia sp.]